MIYSSNKNSKQKNITAKQENKRPHQQSQHRLLKKSASVEMKESFKQGNQVLSMELDLNPFFSINFRVNNSVTRQPKEWYPCLVNGSP